MSRLVRVDLSPQNVTVVGEEVAPGLAIVPVVTPEGGYNGMFTLVHTATGITWVDHRRQQWPITHLRFLAQLMSDAPGVDWCKPIPDGRARAVARGCAEIVAALTVDALLQAMDEREAA